MVSWPDIKFGPVNLWTLVDAYWFYMSPEEKAAEFARITTVNRG
jgi:hypothetical protein